ncbi:MAG: Glutamyl-tRNA reductase [Phycisphaerae bacterium]|nr:Glutamyl-tRNA reductase [Phycisphaerae bacterium]
MRILLLGCNHKTAPLAIRERVAFDDAKAAAALEQLRVHYPDSEAVLLSTCNRVELYLARPVHGHPRSEEVIDFLARFHGVPLADLTPLMYVHQNRTAVDHLLRVACSLDSLVLGETQILGQVRNAFRLAQERKTAGPVLARLCQDALGTGKRVYSETTLASGHVSVASIAVHFARQIFDRFSDKRVLLVGAGKMGEQTLARVAELKPAEVLVTNRSPERAERLASLYAGRAMPFGRLTEALAAADIVITSTGSTEPIIDHEMMAAVCKARRYRPIFLIDIAVPRDVQEAVGGMSQVYLYNIDDLQRAVADNLNERAAQIEQAERIVTQQTDQFMNWFRSRAVGPTIAALRERLAGLGADEVGWLLPKLTEASPRDRELIEQFAHRLINKVLHEPIQKLSAASREPDAGPADMYAQSLIQLFGLNVEGSPGAERVEGEDAQEKAAE